MTKKLLLRTIIVWFLLIPVAIINGSIRNYYYLSKVGSLLAHQISTVMLSIIFLLIIYFFIKWNRKQMNIKNSLMVGLLWSFLTSLFEFGFGHYIMGNTWDRLLYDYNLLAGRLWIFVLLVLFFGPVMIYERFFKH